MTEEKRVTSIRGIDRGLYERASLLARETGRTVGEVINEALRMLVSAVELSSRSALGVARQFVEGVREGEERAIVVKDVDELSIGPRDLEEVEGVVFRNIKRLEISPEVPYDLFEERVRAIVLCDEVVVPEDYPKLKVLEKCRLVKRIVVH